MNQLTTTAPTISSLEIVAMINDYRKHRGDQPVELRHDSLLAKVPKVLGSIAQNFLGKYSGSNGKLNPCYYLPKREACLLAMSYSYELQAKVYDRMTELEAAQSLPSPNVLHSLYQAVQSIQSRLDAMASIQTAAQAALSLIEPKPKQGTCFTLVRSYYKHAKQHCKRAIRFAELQHQAAQLSLALVCNEEAQAKLGGRI